VSHTGPALNYPAACSERCNRLALDYGSCREQADFGILRSPTPAGISGGVRMPTYVNLVKWTDQGIKNYKDSPSRAADFAKLVESLGGSVRELLWTTGEYDLVTVIELPDDETAAAAGLRVGSLGSIRTTTMRAFSADEMGSIITKAG
jgi:uncharacterized protein with GYD domain